MVKIVKVLGVVDLEVFLSKYSITLPLPLQDKFTSGTGRKPWSRFVNTENSQFCSDPAIQFLDNCLKYDFANRMTAAEAMNHAYFDDVRNTML